MEILYQEPAIIWPVKSQFILVLGTSWFPKISQRKELSLN